MKCCKKYVSPNGKTTEVTTCVAPSPRRPKRHRRIQNISPTRPCQFTDAIRIYNYNNTDYNTLKHT